MKRIILLVFVIVAAIFITACGGSAPAAAQAPAEQPSGQSAGDGTEVIITLDDNTIESSLTTFQVGVPYTFVITNMGTHGHNFNIAEPVSVAGSLNAALKTALLTVPKSQLGSGAKVTVQYTFPDTAVSTQLELSCLIQRHYNDGMYLAITVTN